MPGSITGLLVSQRDTLPLSYHIPTEPNLKGLLPFNNPKNFFYSKNALTKCIFSPCLNILASEVSTVSTVQPAASPVTSTGHPPFIGRYFESRLESSEVKVEFVEPGGREPENVDWIKCEPEAASESIKLEHTESSVAVKQGVGDDQVVVKQEPGDGLDGSDLVAAKLEVVLKEEPPDVENSRR